MGMWSWQYGQAGMSNEHGQEGKRHESKKNRTFRPHTFSNFTNIENNLDYVYLSHPFHIHSVYLSHSFHIVDVYLNTSLIQFEIFV